MIGGHELAALLDQVRQWAEIRSDIRAVALVGSYARGTAHPESDIDLVVLTTDPAAYVDESEWIDDLDGSLVVTRSWGPITERRITYPGGLELEFGFGHPSWASTDPLDAGTRGVVTDGMRIVYDPDGILGVLQRALDS